MLRKLFSGGAAAASAVKSDSDGSLHCGKEQAAAGTDFPQLVSRLEDFEGASSSMVVLVEGENVCVLLV